MGYVSCMEDNEQRIYDSRMMLEAFEERLIPKTTFVSVSPPLQPAIASIAMTSLRKGFTPSPAERAHALREKHVLALYELMPGKSWRQ